MSLSKQEYIISGKHYAVVYFNGDDYKEISTNIENQEMRLGLKYQVPTFLRKSDLIPKGLFENRIQDNLYVVTVVDYFKIKETRPITNSQILPTYFNFLLSENDYNKFLWHSKNFEEYLALCLLSIKYIEELQKTKILYEDIISAFFRMNGLFIREKKKEEIVEIEADSLIDCFNQWYYQFD